MTDKPSSDNIPKPVVPELQRPTGHVLGDGLVKAIGGLVLAGLLAFGGWMTSMWSTQNDLAQKSAEVSIKLDILTKQMAEAKSGTIEATSEARDNTRRLDRIEATRFTDADAQKVLAPLEHRIERLESTRRR